MTWEEWKKEQAKFRINKIDHQKQRKMDWKKEWLIIFLVTIFFLFVGYVLVILVGNVNAIGIWEIETDKQLAFAGEDITVFISGDIDGYCNLELINESQGLVFTEFISLGDDGNVSYTFTALESWDSGTYILRVFWYDRVLAFTSMDIIYDAEYLQDMRIDELEKKLNDERRLNQMYRSQVSFLLKMREKWMPITILSFAFGIGTWMFILYFFGGSIMDNIKQHYKDKGRYSKLVRMFDKRPAYIAKHHETMRYRNVPNDKKPKTIISKHSQRPIGEQVEDKIKELKKPKIIKKAKRTRKIIKKVKV
jgi:hypothetical protein